MYSKSFYALFLLALVACQAAPSPKIIEKSTSETATKLTKEDIKPEDTGADKDRAKKSTTFCVEVRSGKEEMVPCKQEIPVKEMQQVLNLKTLDYKPMATVMQPVPTSVQYPVSNILVQQPQISQLSPSLSLLQQPSQFVVHSTQPQQQVPQQQVPQQQVLQQQVPQQQVLQQQVPQPLTQQHVIHVQTQPQETASASVSQVQSQQPTLSAPASAPAPTPIINIIPAPASAPCEKSGVPQQPQPLPPQHIHTVHVVQPTQLISQLSKQETRPTKLEQEKPQVLPVSHQGLSVLTPAARPCKTEMLLAPSSPMELVYHEEEPTRLVEYVPVQQELYECSCRSDQQKTKPSKHHVMLHSGSYSGSRSFRSPMMLQYNPSIGESEESPIIAQAREMV
ncbi:uncharacterized protein LOC126849518 isoform X2 [Cataglyphis hispanica]|uniref:uncharacterized protein LOC126849518 isoform X2 n=1 Tax=Cataglyphis hispanica TaxID=1086592 RepID=UPI00217FE601|nr:uncharacterized protein LOC126849518 isoform X2 [Cataglyphis hispanica]